METPDPSGAVSAIVKILRKATRIVQLAPFAYLVFYICYMLLGSFASEETLCAADAVLYANPLTTIGFLAGSKLFKLCRWHKAACLIPSTSQIESYIDSFVVTFTQEEIIFINTAIGLLALAFLIFAIKHFTHARR